MYLLEVVRETPTKTGSYLAPLITVREVAVARKSSGCEGLSWVRVLRTL